MNEAEEARRLAAALAWALAKKGRRGGVMRVGRLVAVMVGVTLDAPGEEFNV